MLVALWIVQMASVVLSPACVMNFSPGWSISRILSNRSGWIAQRGALQLSAWVTIYLGRMSPCASRSSPGIMVVQPEDEPPPSNLAVRFIPA